MDRKCITCKKEKPLEVFAKVRGQGFGQRCDVCRVKVNSTTRQFFSDNTSARVGYEYGLSEEEYTSLKISHAGRCAICCDEKPLVVDHCHYSGKVRGLLCNPCNVGLGFLKDSKPILTNAIDYLSRHDLKDKL